MSYRITRLAIGVANLSGRELAEFRRELSRLLGDDGETLGVLAILPKTPKKGGEAEKEPE